MSGIKRLEITGGESGETLWVEPSETGEYVEWDDVYDKLMLWISVNDRLPDNVERFGYSQRVLVAVKADEKYIVRIDNYDTLSKSWIGVDPILQPDVTITHWMPLPSAPE